MKMPSNLFDEIQINAIKKQGIEIDFEKDYSDDEILMLEDKFENLVMDNQFNKVSFYENLLDTFQDATK